MSYIGVCPRPHRRLYETRLKFNRRLIYLKTWHDPVVAARVRDVAAKWLYGPDARLNFPDAAPVAPAIEAQIAGWLLDRGVPLSFLRNRIPLPTLLAAGVQRDDLIQAGISAAAIDALL